MIKYINGGIAMKKYKFIIIPILLVTIVAIILILLPPQISSENPNAQTSPQLPDDALGTPFLIEINDLGAYTTFIENCKDLPYDFVTWDMVKSLGTFCSFYVYKDAAEYEEYTYNVYVGNGDFLSLKIVPETNLYDGTLPSVSSIPEFGTTMAQLVNKNKLLGYYESGEITYGYGNNNLYMINWVINGIGYHLSSGSICLHQLADYDPDTILGKLLSVDPEVQLSALNQLKAAIENT